MGRRLIFDTNTLIDYERLLLDRSQFADDDLAIGAISVAEYRVGVELADTAKRRQDRLDVLADLQREVETLDYTEATAIEHAKLIAFIWPTRRLRSPHDLIIAAHAVQTNRIVVSSDAAAAFGDLPGVTAITPTR